MPSTATSAPTTKRKNGYAVVMVGGNVYQDRQGRYEFRWIRCFAMTISPRSACYRGTIHHLPFRGGKIPGYIPPFVPEGSWKS